MITQSELKQALRYDCDSGELKWLSVRPRSSANVGDIAGCLDHRGYRVIKLNKVRYYAHRLIWLYLHGSFPLHQIDHINGRRDDNREFNIRDVTGSENMKNQKRPKCNNSGVVGVYWFKSFSKWAACIKVNNKQKHLGSFDEFDDAVCARKDAEIKYGFSKNHGRA